MRRLMPVLFWVIALALAAAATAGEPGSCSDHWWWSFGHWCPDVPLCPYCPPNYCPKGMPPIPCKPPCGCDDYCPKGMPPIPCKPPCGCDDYCGKKCAVPISPCCFPWYRCCSPCAGP